MTFSPFGCLGELQWAEPGTDEGRAGCLDRARAGSDCDAGAFADRADGSDRRRSTSRRASSWRARRRASPARSVTSTCSAASCSLQGCSADTRADSKNTSASHVSSNSSDRASAACPDAVRDPRSGVSSFSSGAISGPGAKRVERATRLLGDRSLRFFQLELAVARSRRAFLEGDLDAADELARELAPLALALGHPPGIWSGRVADQRRPYAGAGRGH